MRRLHHIAHRCELRFRRPDHGSEHRQYQGDPAEPSSRSRISTMADVGTKSMSRMAEDGQVIGRVVPAVSVKVSHGGLMSGRPCRPTAGPTRCDGLVALPCVPAHAAGGRIRQQRHLTELCSWTSRYDWSLRRSVRPQWLCVSGRPEPRGMGGAVRD